MIKRYRVAVAILGTVLVDAPDKETAAGIAGAAIPSLGAAPIFDTVVKAWTLDDPLSHTLAVHDVELNSQARRVS